MIPLLTPWLVVPLALLVLFALVVRGLYLGYPAPRVPLRWLSRKEQAILSAAADALFPAGGPIPLSGTEAGALPYLDAYVGRVAASQRALMRLLFQAVEHGPWLLGPRFARFTRLDPAARVAFLRRLAKSDRYFLRIVFLTLRLMLTMAYLANAEVARRMRMVANLEPFRADVGEPSEPSHDVPTPGHGHGVFA